MALIDTLLAPLVGATLTWLSERRLPETTGTVVVEGLQAPVEILRDAWGVPHIYAANTPDALFGQGFVHAQERLWQMEFQRRLVAGRLAEVLGSEALPVDRWMRTLGMRRVAEQEVGFLGDSIRTYLVAFVAGINAWIERRRLPVEFTLLRYEPEPWGMADSLSWIKMMSWTLSVNWEAEILRTQLVDRLGPECAAELEPRCAGDQPCIVPPGEPLCSIGDAGIRRADAARTFTGPPADSGLGSNNWVLSGSRTTTGKPLLANDTHLSLSAPAIWYENHVVSDELDITGITFPGIPGVVIGHNGHVAWGFTNGFPDVQDLYIERIRRLDGGRVQVEFEGEWHDAEVRREQIRVRDADPVTEEVITTRHGPIINNLAPDFSGEQPLALRWVSLEPDRMIEALEAMAQARDCEEFREALRFWSAPTQNIVYADTQGNIAYSFPGKVPIRARGDGRVPVPGWTGEYEWTGYVPFEELPHLYNPSQGYLATANNRVVGPDYPHYLGIDHCTGDRAQRIIELIEAKDRIDVPYIQRMQFDQVLPAARIVARYVGQLVADDADMATVVEVMRDWDGALAADSPAAAIYEVFVRRVSLLMLEGRLGDLAARYTGKGPTSVLAEGSIFGQRVTEWLQDVLADPNSYWFDLGDGEDRDRCLKVALRETIEFLKQELGSHPEGWSWGQLHRLTFRHTLGGARPLDQVFNRGPYPVGGDGGTIWATGGSFHNLKSEAIVGPPYRFIADLGDLRNSLGVLVPGQSGHPGSPHYDDQIEDWFTQGYHPILYAREDVEKALEGKLRLEPPV
jgi:penicillin amidase